MSNNNKNYLLTDIAIECFEKSRHNKKLLPLDSIKNYIILYHEKPPTSGKGHFDPSPTAIVRRSINVSPAQKVPIGNQPPEIVSVSQTVEVINLPDILRAKTDAQISRVFSKSCDIRSRNKIIKDIIISERAESTSGQIQITKLNDLNLTKRTRLFNISKIRQSSATQKVPAYITPDLDNFKLKPANNVEILLSNTTPTNINFGQKMSIEQIERKSLNNTPAFSATVVGLKLH